MSATPSQHGAAPAESAASSSPSSPEPVLDDDDADSFVLQHSNASQSSVGATSARQESAAAIERRVEPIVPIMNLPPEVLIMILQKLSAPQDLFHSLLVCKKWARCAIDLLWHRPLFTEWAKLTNVAHAIQSDKQTWPYADMVKRLNLSNLVAINDGSLQPFATCKRIERLTLTGCTDLTDRGIITLVEGNRNLLALDITGISNITDSSIQALAHNCPRLQGLNITGCHLVTDASLVPLAESCKHLKRLKLNKCANLTDASIEAFATRCPSMLEIDLQGCDLVTDPAITALLRGGRHLRELRLAMCQKVTDHAFQSIPYGLKFESLRILDLTACFQLTDDAVKKIIDSAPRLRILVLAKCIDITDKAVEAIARLGKNLHDIHLGRCTQITDDALRELITKCNRIRYIDLAGCTRVTDQSVSLLANLPKLRRIGLVKCHNITDASIQALARGNSNHGPPHGRSQLSSSLERVHLSYCVNITLDGVRELLGKCPKLTHLSLTGIQAFFQRDDLTAFCRDAPPEFNDDQRLVFCVFSGDGVHKLRQHLAKEPANVHGDDVSMYDDGPDSDDIGAGDLPTATAAAPQYPLSAPPYTTQAPHPFPSPHGHDGMMMEAAPPLVPMHGHSGYGPLFGGPSVAWNAHPHAGAYPPSNLQYLQHQGAMRPLVPLTNSNLALHSGPPAHGPGSMQEQPHGNLSGQGQGQVPVGLSTMQAQGAFPAGAQQQQHLPPPQLLSSAQLQHHQHQLQHSHPQPHPHQHPSHFAPPPDVPDDYDE